jgi:hypothetical protein
MDITGPVKTEQGWVFSLRIKFTDCDDAPVRIWSMPNYCKDAVEWAKENCSEVFFPTFDENFLLGIVDDNEALIFKLKWM